MGRYQATGEITPFIQMLNQRYSLINAVSTGKLKPEYYADYINFYGIKTAFVPNTPVAVVNNEKYILIANDSL